MNGTVLACFGKFLVLTLLTLKNWGCQLCQLCFLDKIANSNIANFAFGAELPTLTFPTLALVSFNSANFGLHAKSWTLTLPAFWKF
jgi:hypothetical protein